MHMCALNTYVYMESGGFLCLNSTMGCADPPFLSNPNPAFYKWMRTKHLIRSESTDHKEHPTYSADSIHGEKAKSCIQNK